MGDDKFRFVLTWWNDHGGYWAIEYPELYGCVSDGKTILEAIQNGEEAKKEWLEEVDRYTPVMDVLFSESFVKRSKQ